MKTYVTFGSNHTHRINGKTIDCNCVAVIESTDAEAGRARAFELFGRKWSMEYPEQFFNMDSMKYYPRGFIEVD